MQNKYLRLTVEIYMSGKIFMSSNINVSVYKRF